MGLVDFRCRPPIPEYLRYFEVERMRRINARTGGAGIPRSLKSGSLAEFFAELDGASIETAVMVGRIAPPLEMGSHHPAANVDAKRLATMKQEWPGRFAAFAPVDMTLDASQRVASVAEAFDVHLLDGLFIEPGRTGGFRLDGEDVMSLVEICRLREKPVMLMSGPYAGRTMNENDPAPFETLATTFPSVRFVIGHGLWPYASVAVALIYKYDNVFLSPDFYTFMPAGEPYVAAMRSPELRKQMIFGSGYPVHDVAEMAARYRAALSEEDFIVVADVAPNRVLGMQDD